MLRLTETGGVGEGPASFQAAQAARKARIWAACWIWNGSPVSSNLRVEDCRFIPSLAAQTAVALAPAPPRTPPDPITQSFGVGLETQQPRWIGKHRTWVRLSESPAV